MKKLAAFTLGLSLCMGIFAQGELNKYQHRGQIVFENGDEFTGIIEASDASPWSRQDDVEYYGEEKLALKRIKNKDKEKVKAKEAKSMIIGDKKYEVIKYGDMTAVGTASIPRPYFLEVVADGKIKLYKYYHKPMTAGNMNEVEQSHIDCRNNPDYLILKGDMKLKPVQNVDLREYLEDVPEVYEKYLAGEYGNKPVKEDQSKFMAKVQTGASISMLNESITAIVQDYNKKAE